ncbi:hypothetical protein N8D56_27585 (plasmid) [Devosia sp. A8/3-2]|nr:hypothetical protein N8D56_27585 [Devosia sp. A8/3-2]
MDEKYANAREYLFIAIRSLAASGDSLESRLISATTSIVQITIDQFDDDPELKVRFARIWTTLAPIKMILKLSPSKRPRTLQR